MFLKPPFPDMVLNNNLFLNKKSLNPLFFADLFCVAPAGFKL
jgi:hypothetical protein